MSEQNPEYPLLVLDTSSRTTWVGLKLGPAELTAKSEEQDPSKTLFKLVGAVLEEAQLPLDRVAAIAFCAGPGSMLGARTASMAIRAWKGIGIPAAERVYYYNSLQVGALLASKTIGGAGIVVTDARRSSWNVLPFPSSSDADLALLTNQDLEACGEQIVSFSQFPTWTKTSAQIAQLSYDPTPLFLTEAFLPLLSPTQEPAPITGRANEYKKWDARIHSAPDV
jgi:tRNA A37 threonylcarbamoyladenosine modification protein TsaB